MDRLFTTLRIWDKDAFQIKWVRSVNSEEEWQYWTQKPEKDPEKPLMIESDVIIDRSTGQPVMGDPPETSGSFTFENWLRCLLNSTHRIGGEAEFKSVDALNAAMQILNDASNRSIDTKKDPILLWFSADVCKGPSDAPEPEIDARRFSELCHEKALAGHVLSLGWTTPEVLLDVEDYLASSNVDVGVDEAWTATKVAAAKTKFRAGLGAQHIEAMRCAVDAMPPRALISYSVRARLVAQTDWALFERRLMMTDEAPTGGAGPSGASDSGAGNFGAGALGTGAKSRFSVTVWTSVFDQLDERDIAALLRLRNAFGKSRVFFQLPILEWRQLDKAIRRADAAAVQFERPSAPTTSSSDARH